MGVGRLHRKLFFELTHLSHVGVGRIHRKQMLSLFCELTPFL